MNWKAIFAMKIERQMEAGRNELSAFEFAAEKVGQARSLKTEFSRAQGFLDWLGGDPNARMIRILSLLWMVIYAWGFINFGWKYFTVTYQTDSRFDFNLTQLLLEFIYLRALLASVRLFRGNSRDKRLLWLLAIFFPVVSIVFFTDNPNFHHAPISWGFWANLLMVLASVWYLRPSRKAASVAK